MRRRLHETLLLLLAFVGACRMPDMCTLNYVYGLNIYVSDRSTQASLVDGSTVVVASDGSFVDTVTAFAGTFNTAGERPGRYTVTAERLGYQKWTQANVVVRDDGCHVEPVSLHARLQAASR
jgi:hypothetical protein